MQKGKTDFECEKLEGENEGEENEDKRPLKSNEGKRRECGESEQKQKTQKMGRGRKDKRKIKKEYEEWENRTERKV